MKTKCKKCSEKEQQIAALVKILRTILKRYKLEASDYYTALDAVGVADRK